MHVRSLAVAASAAALVVSGSMASQAVASTQQAGRTGLLPQVTGKPIPCTGLLALGDAPKAKIVVPAGASCTIMDSTVKSVRGLPGAVDVKVLNTDVRRNLMVRGATGTVHIGDPHCIYDPNVGNNIIVRNSHNVLICAMRVRNNVMVRNNDGRITVRDSVVRRSIRVNRNLAYAPHPGETGPPWAGVIHLIDNTAGGHIVARDNDPSRGIGSRGNTPAVIIA